MKIMDLFRRKKDRPVYSHSARVQIWEYIEPIARGESYEDPLDEALEKHSLGEVVGGGSMMDAKGEITFVDVELMLADTDRAVRLVAKEMERLGAPAGSEIIFEKDGAVERVRCGKVELLVLYLDGISLPDEVYAVTDLDVLSGQIQKLLGTLGGPRNSWQGVEETALCLECQDAEKAFARIEPFLRENPSFQNCRVVVRSGNPALHPREIRLPRHDGG